MIRGLIASMLVLGVVAVGHGQTAYRWTQPDGSVVFSDRPPEDDAAAREEVELRAAPYSSPRAVWEGRAEGAAPAGAGRQVASAGYSTFVIASPVEDANIRGNTGDVEVLFSIEPELLEGHVIEMFLNGKSVGTGRQASVLLSNLDRGTHTVRARIRGRGGEQLASTDPVTFNLQRTSVFQPGRLRAVPLGGGN